MDQTLAIPQPRGADRGRGRLFHLIVGAGLGMLVGALGFAIAESALDIARAELRSEDAVAASSPEFASRPLPREWRWEPKAVEYGHMYRREPTPRLDWIRESGRR